MNRISKLDTCICYRDLYLYPEYTPLDPEHIDFSNRDDDDDDGYEKLSL